MFISVDDISSRMLAGLTREAGWLAGSRKTSLNAQLEIREPGTSVITKREEVPQDATAPARKVSSEGRPSFFHFIQNSLLNEPHRIQLCKFSFRIGCVLV